MKWVLSNWLQRFSLHWKCFNYGACCLTTIVFIPLSPPDPHSRRLLLSPSTHKLLTAGTWTKVTKLAIVNTKKDQRGEGVPLCCISPQLPFSSHSNPPPSPRYILILPRNVFHIINYNVFPLISLSIFSFPTYLFYFSLLCFFTPLSIFLFPFNLSFALPHFTISTSYFFLYSPSFTPPQ